MAKTRPVTIVVPVYADWPSLNDCLESINKHVDLKTHRLLLINDCGPEADAIENAIKNLTKNWPSTSYHRNSKNLGYLKTCNRAVELDETANDILLLNSDTEVTAGFLEEMSAVLYAAEKHGAVSPRSNNATIATVPLWAISQKGIDAGKAYRAFLKLKNRLPRYTIVPTAHGFCMLVKRSLIKKYGLYDQVFGKGYGEEVDFCQRLKQAGYLSLLANRAFVFHLEARSFTLETKARLIEANNKILRSRYPGYQKEVRAYIQAAQIREGGPLFRFKLGFAAFVAKLR